MMSASGVGWTVGAVVFGGKIRRAFAVDTGSKMVVVEGWRAADRRVWRAGEDQFASAIKVFGRAVEMVDARCWIVESGIVSRMDMSAMARERSLLALLMAMYWAVREGEESVLIPVIDMPSSSS
jgi:hypothetical protein